LNFFKKVFGEHKPVDTVDMQPIEITPEARELGCAFVNEYIAKGGTNWSTNVKLANIQSWKVIKSSPLEMQAQVCVWACSSGLLADRYKKALGHGSSDALQAELKLGSTLLRSKLPFNEMQLADMIKWCAARRSLEWENPVVSVVGATERILGNQSAGKVLQKALNILLKKCRQEMRHSNTEALRKLRGRVEVLLDPKLHDQSFQLPRGVWKLHMEKELATIPEAERKKWLAIFEYAGTARGSKPSQKWLAMGRPLITTIGIEVFQTNNLKWLQEASLDPERPDAALDIIKGLVWMTIIEPNDVSISAVSRFAEYAYVKIPNIGARSKKVGNACCVALMEMSNNQTAIAELVRLRGKIKYPSVRGQIQKKLETIAHKKNVTVAELEDASLPKFGFDLSGQFIQVLGDFTATVMLEENKAVLKWADKLGKQRKTIPTAVKSDFKVELTNLKRLVKDMSNLLAGQIKALEQSYISNREWIFSAWELQYWNHPVRRNITQSLLWYITDGGNTLSVLPTENGLEDQFGEIYKPSERASVKLWHPLFEDIETILLWRDRIESLELTQPFKQAHREIYLVTDAENQTEVYSNRFAAHILKQHQFKALCNARDWTYTLQGMWDSWNIPQKNLPAFGIIAEYAVEMIDGDEQTVAGIPLYITADQVRFRTTEPERLNIRDVPSIVFSEIMRDVDLFVAVTSVANDPNWTDGGPDGRFGAYWQSYSFGDLGETAKTRRDMISKLVPKLAIADKLEVGSNFLTVKGQRHEYKIHFGSGNIMIMPSNKYLCIVKAPPHKTMDKVHLPFTGDNLLTIILSKAFMLVNDDKITDKTILSQLG